ncbi:M48 family metallopeptidase [Desulfosporosinus acidiphilus]|uniref:M48 family metallopeptidase n=1 Tax=Desulfosporosinus acidiphilus TaxID=885581 RepID=UPI000674EF94|nr:SprT family zinc-dependent metalloprotease [Desulfosporosinus acidiphilus]
MNQLSIGDEIIPYEERRSVRYRRITLSILNDRVRISAPKYVPKKQIKELLRSKEAWIIKHWLEKRQRENHRARNLENHEHILFRGHLLELCFKYHSYRRIHVGQEGQMLVVSLPQEDIDSQSEAMIRDSIIAWYKFQARTVFKQKLDTHSRRMQVTYQDFRLKDQKTRWGSCSSRGNLNLNWRIIMAPDQVIDYLIIHELAHLTHLNHSPEFWQRVERFIPEFLTWRKWLKEHGHELVL